MTKASILYIEDERFFGDLLSRKLFSVGISTTIASTGEMGIEFASSQKFDLILLDILLPGMDGFEVLEKLKDNPKTKDIPVIVLSNLDTNSDKGRAKKLGAEDFMVKMLTSPEKILFSIEKIVSKK